jgi:hypothetical protein
MAQFDAGSESSNYKLFTGLTDVQVVAINPTKDEAEKLGINMKNDPVYVSTDETSGNKKVRLDIYVKSGDTDRIDKMAFFMEDATKTSSAGNTQFINDFGTSCYSESIETATTAYQWFKPQGARPAISGEPELIDFLKGLLNVGRDSIAKLDNVKALFTGNVTELKEIFKKFSDRKIQVLYYVRENDGNWYQSIYARYFSRAGNKTTKYWEKHFENSTNKLNYQNSFKFQEFNPLAVAAEGTKPINDAPAGFWGS